MYSECSVVTIATYFLNLVKNAQRIFSLYVCTLVLQINGHSENLLFKKNISVRLTLQVVAYSSMY